MTGRKKGDFSPVTHRSALYCASPSVRRPAALRKDDSVDIRSVSKLACRFQCFNPFWTWRHVPRGGQSLVGAGLEIVRTRRHLLDVHHPPISASEAHRKASRLLRISSDQRELALHGCVRTWCIAASSAQILRGPRSSVEQACGNCIADSGDVLFRVVSKSMLELRSWLLPEIRREHNTLSHR
jgi:hypothetical protein